MTYPVPDLPTPSEQTRADGWSPARQRRFLEVLAETGVIRLACEAVRITQRSAYNLRIRRDGAAFRLGWDAAVLIARARLADTLLARAIMGQEEVITRDPDNHELRRHRHDNRLAMSMLARLDRMADCPAEGTDAALARVVAQDFAAYLDMLCAADVCQAELDGDGLPRTGMEPAARTMDDARLLDGSMPETPAEVEATQGAAAILSPGAQAALFIATRRTLLSTTATTPQYPQICVPHEHRELRPASVDLMTLPPDDAAARLRGIWWDDHLERFRTDYPAPPGFTGDQTDDVYEIDIYHRDLTEEEEEAYAAVQQAERLPYERAAARARDRFFGLDAQGHGAEAQRAAA